MNYTLKIVQAVLATFICVISIPAFSQITILNATVTEFNVTPSSLCRVNIMNAYQQELDAFMEAKIFNSNNDLLLSVKTNPFHLKRGINAGASLNISIQSTNYSMSPQAEYVKTHQSLPSGNYKYCCVLTPLGNIEPGDEYCTDVLSEINSFLILVSPADKDTIETPRPVLMWNHSEPFNVLSPGEYFRMVVAELSSDQTPEAGVKANTPVFQKTYLTAHSVQYPFDLQELKKGKRYGWEVQKISNGNIIAQTEAWEFVIQPEKVITYNKYAVLKKTLDGGFYTAENNKLFFRFEEEYNSSSPALHCVIYDWQRKPIEPKAKNEVKKETSSSSGNAIINVKVTGLNRFELNLDDLDIKKGYYTLEVKNEKGELFILKFYVPQ